MELAPPQRTGKHGVRMHEPSLSLRRPGDKPELSLSGLATMTKPLHVTPTHVRAGDRVGLVSRHRRRAQGGTPHPFGSESCAYGLHRCVPGVDL
jgi:hypothetical protein